MAKPGITKPPGPGGQNQQPCLLSGRAGTWVTLPEVVISTCEPVVTVESVMVETETVGNTVKVVVGTGVVVDNVDELTGVCVGPIAPEDVETGSDVV